MNTAPTGTATTLANTPTLATWALAAISSCGPRNTTGSSDDRLMPNKRDKTSIANASGKTTNPPLPSAMRRARAARRPALIKRPPRYAPGNLPYTTLRKGPMTANGASVISR